MKICMPTMGKDGLKEKVHNHFGSAEYFTIYNTETKDVEVIDNSGKEHAHGACQPLKAVAGYDIDIVLTSGMGKRAINKINAGGIKIYKLEGDIVEEAVQKFEAGELQELTPAMGCGGHSHGGGCC